MHDESVTTASLTSLSMRVHTGENNGCVNMNAVGGMASSLSHLSLPSRDTPAAADATLHGSHTIHPSPAPYEEGGTPVQYNLQPTQASTHPSEGAVVLRAVGRPAQTGDVADMRSLLSGAGPLTVRADAAAAPCYVSDAPTAGRGDNSPANAKSQLLLALRTHTPTSPRPDVWVVANVDGTVHNAGTGGPLQPASPTFTSPVIADGGNGGHAHRRHVRHFPLVKPPQSPPPDAAFLAAASTAEDPLALPASTRPGRERGGDADTPDNGRPRATGAERGRLSTAARVSRGEHPPCMGPAAACACSSSSSSLASSVSSMSGSTAETRCHAAATAVDKGRGADSLTRLSLPTAIDLLTASTCVSSFTVSSASATASPHPTTYAAASPTHSVFSPTSSEATLGKPTAVLAGVHDSAGGRTSKASWTASVNSPLIALEQVESLESVEAPSVSQPAIHDSASELRRGRSTPTPRPFANANTAEAPRASEKKKSSTLHTATPTSTTVSGSGYTTTHATVTTSPSSHYSTITIDSAFVRPPEATVVGMRATSPDPTPHARSPPPPPPKARLASSGSLISPAVTPLTSFTRPSTAMSNALAGSTFFGLPAFMSASTVPLAGFCKLDAPLRAAMAAAPTPSGSGSSAAAVQDSQLETTGSVLTTSEVHARPPPTTLHLPRYSAALQVDHASSTATNDDGRDSHFQLSSDARTVDNSSFHSPSMPQQSSRAFTVTSASFRFDTLYGGTASSPRSHKRAVSGLQDSATSLYHSSSMLSDNVLQTLAHGMALGGVSSVPWRSVAPDPHNGCPNPFSASSSAEADRSLFGNRSTNNAYVRLPSSPPSHQIPTRRTSHAMQASTAAGTLFYLPDTSLTGASSVLYQSSLAGVDAHANGSRPFLASMRGLSAMRSSHASPAAETPTAEQEAHAALLRHQQQHQLLSGRQLSPAAAVPALRSAASPLDVTPPPTTAAVSRGVAPVRTRDRALPYPLLSSSSQRPPHPPGSGSFFAAADDAPHPVVRFASSHTGDYPVVHGSASLMMPHCAGRSLSVMTGSHAMGVAGADASFPVLSPASSSPRFPSTRQDRSFAPTSTALSGALSDNSIFVLYGARSTDDFEGGRSQNRSCKSSGAMPDQAALPCSSRRGRDSAVARGRLPSCGFSTADSNTRPMAPAETPQDVQTTFLQSVHVATVNAVGAPHGCSSALRQFLMSGSSTYMTASVPFFSCSFAGSQCGRGTYGGDVVAAELSTLQPSQAAVAEGSMHACEAGAGGGGGVVADVSSPMPHARPVPPGALPLSQETTSTAAREDGDAQAASCSLISPAQLLGRATAAAPSVLAVSDPTVDKRAGRGNSGDFANLLPLVEREHASISGSCRLPTLRSLGSSVYQCRVERASEQMGASRHSTAQCSQWGARGRRLERRRGSSQTPINSSSSFTAESTYAATQSSPDRSKPYASSHDASAATPLHRDASPDTDAQRGATPAALAGQQPARDTNPQSRRGDDEGSHPCSAKANRGLLSSDLTHRSSQKSSAAGRGSLGQDSNSRGVNRGLRCCPNGSVGSGVAIVAANADDGAGRNAADGIRRVSIPAFRRHRDVESMLDDAETVLLRVPVSIISVLGSRMRRGMAPGLSVSMGGSASGTGASVLSLQTPAVTSSSPEGDALRFSETVSVAEKTQPSHTVNEASITISSVPLEGQESS